MNRTSTRFGHEESVGVQAISALSPSAGERLRGERQSGVHALR
ncbi:MULTISPECIES: hypothetical protein [Streptomyces]|uniref:Uncharacterized protein n=1 Tax=Streptomyces fimbriatus TaxID=68197 RepID=A0ABW0DA98_STRFI